MYIKNRRFIVFIELSSIICSLWHEKEEKYKMLITLIEKKFEFFLNTLTL